MPDKVTKLPLKCRRGHEIKPPNRLVERIPGVRECLICVEESNHKEIMGYLQTGAGVMFICNTDLKNGSCDISIPGRDCLSLYSTTELLDEIKNRVEEKEAGA